MLRSSVLRRLVRPERLREVLRAFDTLLRVRNEMHLHSNSLNDTLAFTLQPTIAAALEKRQKDPHLAVDRFMQKYYVAARHIAWLASRVHEQSADQWLRPAGWSERKTLDEAFELRHARIHPLRSVRRLTNAYVLRAFLHRAEQRAEFSFGLEDAIHRNEHALRPLSGPAERALWQKLMHLPDGIGRTLQRMNVLGLLARFIPEWAPLVAFFQHNQYHFYTADEHTLLVVANAEGLQNAAGPFADVFRTLRRPDILYWACLLHDIAKPVRLSTHEIAGVPIAQAVLRRCGAADS
jgi:[protein-PII] uridylyltransferase